MVGFSIVCPVYNCEKYIPFAIESVLNQTFKSWELIIIDDCSTDLTGKICDNYSEKNPNIFVIHKKTNEGQYAARKDGLLKAQGDKIVFLDSDDCLDSHCLEFLNQYFHIHAKLDCVVYNCAQIIETGMYKQDIFIIENNHIVENTLSVIEECFFKNTMPTLWRYCFRGHLIKNVITSVRNLDTRIGEDAYLISACLLETKYAYFTNAILYNYRLNPNSICHTLDSNKAFDRFISWEMICSNLSSVFPNIFEIKEGHLINNSAWSIIKYIELGSLQDSKQLFKSRSAIIKKSKIWKKFTKKYVFKSKYPRLLRFLFLFSKQQTIKKFVRYYLGKI